MQLQPLKRGVAGKIMANTIVLLGEPYLGETKFHVGDLLKDAKYPSGERFRVMSIEVQQMTPWSTCVVYTLESNRHGICNGLKDVVESRSFEVVETDDEMRKFFEKLQDRVRTGKMTRLEG